MLQSIDLSATEEKSSDHQLLRAYLQQLANQPFLHFRFSYGDELSLHFGSPRKYAAKRLKHLSKGSYIVAARASHWFLNVTNPPSIIVPASDDVTTAGKHTPVSKQQLETSNFVTQGARILAADPIVFSSASHSRSGFALTLLLCDGTSLFICPNLDEPINEDEEIADWQVFTPHQRCIQVGPGLQWEYADTQATSGNNTLA